MNCLKELIRTPVHIFSQGINVKPTIKQVYYLTQTLWDLVPSTRPSPPRTRPAAASGESKGAAERGGRRRRKTKKRKKRKKKTRKKKTRKNQKGKKRKGKKKKKN